MYLVISSDALTCGANASCACSPETLAVTCSPEKSFIQHFLVCFVVAVVVILRFVSVVFICIVIDIANFSSIINRHLTGCFFPLGLP